jgi:integrase/recombinase XerD
MASVKVLMKMNKLNEKDLAPLYLRIIKNRKTKFISLGIYIKTTEWNFSEGKVRKSHPNSTRLNALIAKRISDAEGVAVELETKSKSVSSRKIKGQIVGAAPVEFFPFADKYMQTLETSGKIGSLERAKTVIKKLRNYRNGVPLYFDDITVSFLKEYEEHLLSKCNNKQNTVHQNLRIIRKLINDAVREDIITRNDNPFYKFTLKLEKTSREYLTEEELKIIENLDLPKDRIINTHRNIYVFAAYAGGLRISDVLTLRWENFDGERINIQIQKTKTPLSIKLPNKALEIINIYKPEKTNPKDFIFPLLKKGLNYSDPKVLHTAISVATAYTNKDLKTIASKANISKHISFHTSRHTFATWALRKGIRIEYVSKLLGHANIKETQVYAKIVNEELEKAMDVFNS